MLRSATFGTALLLCTILRSTFARMNDLHSVIYCVTNRSSLHYIGYGCWCGKGDAKSEPMDPIDSFSCCKKHDHCYDEAAPSYCTHWWFGRASRLQFNSYEFECSSNNRTVTCLDGDENWEKTPGRDACHRAKCECDRTLAECLYANEMHYNATKPECPIWKGYWPTFVDKVGKLIGNMIW